MCCLLSQLTFLFMGFKQAWFAVIGFPYVRYSDKAQQVWVVLQSRALWRNEGTAKYCSFHLVVYRIQIVQHPFVKKQQSKQTKQQKISLQGKGNGKRGLLLKRNCEGCGEGAVGVPGLALLSASAAFSSRLVTLRQPPADHLRGGLIRNSRGKHSGNSVVWNYLTCFPCFKELLPRQQQLAEDECCRVWGWQSWACGGGVSLLAPSCGPCPQLLQILLLPQT